MKKKIHLDLTHDFRTACAVFGFTHEEVIQEFIRRVSLPVYFSDPEYKHRWATLFFLDYVNHLAPEHQQPDPIHEKYLRLLNERTKGEMSKRKTENICRQVLREWRQAVKRFHR